MSGVYSRRDESQVRYEWRDLADSEIRMRLLNRSYDPDQVEELIKNRETSFATQVLEYIFNANE